MKGVGRGWAAQQGVPIGAGCRLQRHGVVVDAANILGRLLASVAGIHRMSTPPSAVRIALAQFNATVGDLPGNARRIVDAAREAHAAGAALLVTPELALCGYPPEDLLLRPAFMQACARTLADLAVELAAFDGLTVVVGHPHQFGERG